MPLQQSTQEQLQPQLDPLSPTVIDILNVLESRQDLVHDQWNNLLKNIQESESPECSDRAVALDAELSRYRRFLSILRKQVQENSAERSRRSLTLSAIG